METYLTVSEIADRLGASTGSVRRWIKQGKIAGHKSEGRHYWAKVEEVERFHLSLLEASHSIERKEISEEDLAYLAGIVDGDGSIMIKKVRRKMSPSYRAYLIVGMACESLITFIHEKLGGRIARYKPKHPNHRMKFSAELEGVPAESALVKLLPYLKLKQRQARLVLEFRKLQGKSRDYKTKVVGFKTIPSSYHPKPFRVRNRVLSDEYLEMCENLYQECKRLNS
jgi:excisionase family DNA binding protein